MHHIYQKRKLIAVLILAVVFILMASSLALADQPDPLLNNKDITDYNTKHPPSYGEKFIAGIVSSSVNWVINLFHVDDPVLLVFNVDPRDPKTINPQDPNSDFLVRGVYGSTVTSGTPLVLGTFPKPFFDVIAIFYDGFSKLLPIPLVLILVILAIIYVLNSGTTEGRNKIKDYTQAFITAVLTLRFGAYIWTAIIWLNKFIVKLVWAYMIQSGVTPGFFMDMIWGKGNNGFNSATQIGSLPLVILLLMAGIMVLALNYQYVMRIIILGILILVFPIVTTASIFPAYRHALQTWMKEFVAQVSLQLAHALALGVFFVLVIKQGIGPGGTFWLMLAYFAGLPSIASLIRELLGLQGGVRSGVLGAAAGMAGTAAMVNMTRMFTRNNSGNSINTGGGTPTDGQADGQVLTQGISSGAGMNLSPKLTGATSTIGKIAQGTFNAGSAVLANRYVQGGLRTAGKGAIGVTAATAGAALSTMTGGSPLTGAMIGGMLGTKTGAKITNLGGKVAGSVGSGVQTVAQSMSTNHGVDMKDIGSNLMAQSMQKGGTLASAGWGLQAAANKISSLAPTNGMFGEKQGVPFAAPSFVEGNKDTIRTAQSGMADLQPRLDMAQAKYEHAKAHFSPDSEEYRNASSQYNSLKDLQSMYKTESLLAQTKLRSPGELQRHTAEFSASRGRLD